MLQVVPYYAAVLALLFLVLSVRVIRGRRAQKIAIGVGDNADLERRVRVHANFAENVPFALVLLAMAEARGVLGFVLHALCLTLLIGRAAHAWGVSRTPEDFRFRVAGMGATLTVIGLSAIILLVG